MTALIVTQASADVLVLGVPNLRVSQSSADVLVLGVSNLRTSQVAVDVLVSTAEWSRPNTESIFGKIDVNNVSFSYTKTGSVGEGNFATRKLFIGSRGGSANYFNGEISDLIVRT